MPGDPIPLGLRPSRTSPQGRGGSGELMRKSKPGRSFHMLQAPSARRRIGSGAASGRSPAPLRSRSGPAPMTQQSASAPSGSPASGKMPPSPAARTKLLLEGPVLPTLLRLAAPNVLNLLAFVGVITFDGFFLGRIGTDALAGASLAFPWVMLVLQTTNSGMGAGVSSAVARALGAGRRERADDLVFHAFLLALALAAVFSTAMLLASRIAGFFTAIATALPHPACCRRAPREGQRLAKLLAVARSRRLSSTKNAETLSMPKPEARLGRIAILSCGDEAARRSAAPATSRFKAIFAALDHVGVDEEPVVYEDDVLEAVRGQLATFDGVLVWVNPIHDGRNRTNLDALLREVATRGVWVSAHPDVILKMGTKEVLHR